MHHDINENGGRLTNAFRFVVQDSKRVEGPVPSAPCTIWPTDLQDPHDGGIEALADQVGRHEPFLFHERLLPCLHGDQDARRNRIATAFDAT